MFQQFRQIVDPDEELDKALLQEEIRECLTLLTPRQSRVIELLFLEEMGNREVARVLGISRQSVYQAIGPAIRKLRHPRVTRRLKPYYEEGIG